jgi:murein DD-endopeptidase MepM/ murein hydrolase activator NlpD
MISLFLLCVSLAAQQDLRPGVPVPLEVSVISEPRALRQEGRTVLVYELAVANPVRSGFVLESLEITDTDGELVGQVMGAAWKDVAQGMPVRGDESQRAQGDGLELAGGARFLLYLWLEVDPKRVAPTELRHVFHVRAELGEEDVYWSMNGPRVPVHGAVMLLDAPVRGGRWYVTNGFANDADHRRFFVAHSEILIPQRFGADFLLLDEGGGNALGAGAALEDFHGFDQPLHAVADGKVVSVMEHLPDNAAGASPGVLDWSEVAGNHVILQLAPNTYALYAHIREGTLLVEVGAQVERGQVLGVIGNSGNSSAPHLHFHLMDRPHPNSSNGVPFHFREFEVLTLDYGFRADQRPLPSVGTSRRASIPRKHSVIRFPGQG